MKHWPTIMLHEVLTFESFLPLAAPGAAAALRAVLVTTGATLGWGVVMAGQAVAEPPLARGPRPVAPALAQVLLPPADVRAVRAPARAQRNQRGPNVPVASSAVRSPPRAQDARASGDATNGLAVVAPVARDAGRALHPAPATARTPLKGATLGQPPWPRTSSA